MTIYAIDPGNSISGVAVIHTDGRTIITIGGEVKPNKDILESLTWLQADEDVVVCEWMQSYGARVGKEVFETCKWVGRFEQLCAELDITFQTVLRHEVVNHICGKKVAGEKMGADARVRQILEARFGKDTTKSFTSHAWQALGVGVAWWENELFQRRLKR